MDDPRRSSDDSQRLDALEDAYRELLTRHDAIVQHLNGLQHGFEQLDRQRWEAQQAIAVLQEQVAKLLDLWLDMQTMQRELALHGQHLEAESSEDAKGEA